MQKENLQKAKDGTWKDRGWWLSVDIVKKRSSKKNYDEALSLLGLGERYDLILDNGKVIARGIFTRSNDLEQLANLLVMIEKWSGTEIYIKGTPIKRSKCWNLARILRCSAALPPCRHESTEKRFKYIGCHNTKYPVCLLHYMPNLNLKERYWFEFYEQVSNDRYSPYYLNKARLIRAVEAANEGLSIYCPMFPFHSLSLIDSLPARIDFNRGDARWWLQGRCKKKNKDKKQTIIPRSPEIYRNWIWHWLRNTFPDDQDMQPDLQTTFIHSY
jgi:hypothetical protein